MSSLHKRRSYRHLAYTGFETLTCLLAVPRKPVNVLVSRLSRSSIFKILYISMFVRQMRIADQQSGIQEASDMQMKRLSHKHG
jgi:hypothetical protein